MVALIITIVILMILAAVAISSITNDQIIGYANNAAALFSNKQKEESSILGTYENFLNNLLGDGEDDNDGDGDGDDNNDNDGDGHTHSYNSGVITKEATCTSNGIITYTCTYSGCNHTTTNSIPTLDHNYVNQVSPAYLKSAATYTSPAIYYKSCLYCSSFGNGGTFTYGDPLSSGGNGGNSGNSGNSGSSCTNHNWQLTENEDYICAHSHSASYHCINCDAEKIEKEGHWPRERITYNNYFVCGCGVYIFYSDIKNSSFDTSSEWFAFSDNGYDVDRNGTWIWDNLWSAKCNCDSYVS